MLSRFRLPGTPLEKIAFLRQTWRYRVSSVISALLLIPCLAYAQMAPGGDGARGDEMGGTIGGPAMPDPDVALSPKQSSPRITRSLSSSASVVISELRLSGPGGSTDEFIELANITTSPIDLTGWTFVAGTVTAPLSPLDLSGKIIPASGHLLLVNSGGYSLSALAEGDASYTGDIDPVSTLSLSDASGTVVDTVGNLWAIAAPLGASDQYSYVRRLESGVPADSGTDSGDFNLVDTLATVSTTGANGVGPLTAPRMGAPGPQNTLSPIQRNAKTTLVPIAPSVGTPAEGRYASKNSPLDSPNGRLTLRRTLTNNTGGTVSQMRFRIVAMTGGTNNTVGIADLRALTSAGVTVNGVKVVQGITLDAPSTPVTPPTGFGPSITGNGGGLNSSWQVVTLPNGLASGDSINVEFLFAIVQNGSYRVVVDTELLSAPDPVSSPDITLERLDDAGTSAQSIGAGVLNDDAHQTLSCVVLPGQTQTFLAHIKNAGTNAASFRLNLNGLLSSTGGDTSWNSLGWTVGATVEGTRATPTSAPL